MSHHHSWYAVLCTSRAEHIAEPQKGENDVLNLCPQQSRQNNHNIHVLPEFWKILSSDLILVIFQHMF